METIDLSTQHAISASVMLVEMRMPLYEVGCCLTICADTEDDAKDVAHVLSGTSLEASVRITVDDGPPVEVVDDEDQR